VPDVAKIYWSLRALGRADDAVRLREAWLAAWGGESAAVREFEGAAEELRDALAALGPSAQARRLREAALARARGQRDERDREDLPEANHNSTARASRAPSDAAASGAVASAGREIDVALATLRRKLAASERAGRTRSSSPRRRRRVRAALAALLVLAVAPGALALALAHRDALGARARWASERLSAASARADAWLGRWAGASPQALQAAPPAVVPTTSVAPRAEPRRTTTAGTRAPALGAPSIARNGDVAPGAAAGRARIRPTDAPAAPEASAAARILFVDLATGELRSLQERSPSETPPRTLPAADAATPP
jgi:hypothetical protein